ncbi:hypothetical protein ES703_45181 [subsurface metagenome]
MKVQNPRPRARDRPRWLIHNLRSIHRRKDRESLFNVNGVKRALEKRSIDLRVMLKPGMYQRISPVLKLSGWKVNPEMVEQMMELRKHGISYGKIAGELDVSPGTVYKYLNETAY